MEDLLTICMVAGLLAGGAFGVGYCNKNPSITDRANAYNRCMSSDKAKPEDCKILLERK